MQQHKFILSGLLLAIVLLYVQPTNAAILTFNDVAFANVTNGTGINLSTGASVLAAISHITWNGTAQPSGPPDALSNPGSARRIFTNNGAKLMMMGPTSSNFLPSALPETNMFMFTNVPVYSAGDGIAFIAPVGNNYTYGIIIVNTINPNNMTVTIRTNNQAGNRSISDPISSGGACGQFTTEQTCSSNTNCFWDFAFQFCKNKESGGFSGGGFGPGAGGFKPHCDFLGGQQSKCGNTTVCTWVSSENKCIDNNTVFNMTTGIVCANLNETSLCNNVRDISPMCTWNSTLASCRSNTSKTFNDFPQPPVQFCEAATDQATCDQLASQFFMPCQWKTNNISNTSTCGFKFGNVFVGDVKNMFDISTEASCKSAGGSFKTESFQTTNSYGQTVTNTKSWCDFDFGYGGTGFSKQSCNETCWACEKNGTTNWPNVAAAQNACDNSALGFCKWSNNSMSPNGLGFCGPDSGMSFGGGGDCNSLCGACIKASICSTSKGNCSWVPDKFNFDLNGDGVFNNLTDGFCEPQGVAFKKDCSKTCNACQSQTACTASAAAGGCSWNSTGLGFNVCVPNGAPKEICFIPGDEDGDGQPDCSDSECLADPFCGFGSSGAGKGGPAAGLGAISESTCTQWDNNMTACNLQKGGNGTPIENQSVCFFHPAPGRTFNATSGWCDPQFKKDISNGMALDKPPVIIGADTLFDSGVPAYLDLGPVGIHEAGGSATKLDIGIAIRNASTAAWCSKVYPSQNRNMSSLFTRYIDTDENTTNGCALDSNSSSLGWDYKFRYFENATSGEQKIAFRCSSGAWVPFSAQLSIMKDMCSLGMGGPGGQGGPGPGAGMGKGDFANISSVNVMIISKGDIGNPKKFLRLYISAGNESRNESNPFDTAGPMFYTPGSIDVKFENCAVPGVDEDGDGLTSDNDPDCQSFLKQGYISFETGPQCQDGLDNDGNGKTDCSDPQCKYDALGLCNSGQGLVCDASDKKSPSLKWFDVKTFPDFTFIKFDSDEPANGSVTFYGNDSTCQTTNATVLDSALLNLISSDNFKPWHDVQLGKQSLNTSLNINTSYYYKWVMSDICGNKVTSACLNFTTSSEYSNFVFKPVPPSGIVIDIPELGVTNDNFTYAKQYNATQTQEISLKLKDTTNGFVIELDNASVLKASSLNISTLYMTSGDEKFVGMNSSSWSKIQTDMSPGSINITIPDNGTELFKCEEGNTSNCTNVTSLVTCSYGTTNTTCEIPLASGLGFSVYKVTGQVTSGGSQQTQSSTSTTSGGGGGGGGAASTPSASTGAPAAGDSILSNAKLSSAIAEVLGTELTGDAAGQLSAQSDVVAASTTVERKLSTSPGQATVSTTVKYTGAQVENYMVYDVVPKEFAADASLITISAPGGKAKTVNSDPEYLITYPKATAGDTFTISYTILTNAISSSITGKFKTEVYSALPVVKQEPAAQEPAQEQTQTPPAAQEQTEQAQVAQPSKPAGGFDAVTVALVIAIIAVLIVLFEAKHRKKSASKRLKI